jgi:hypothetical protein
MGPEVRVVHRTGLAERAVSRSRSDNRHAIAYRLTFRLVVRARPGSRTGILFVIADTNYAAYNDWAAEFLRLRRRIAVRWRVPQHLGTADSFRISTLLRPTVPRRLWQFHTMLGRFPSPNGWRAWTLRSTCARRGICTSRHRALNDHRLLSSSDTMSIGLRRCGTMPKSSRERAENVAFFCGNVCWWQIRLSPDATQFALLQGRCFRSVSTTEDHALTTAHWFDDLVKRPETTLTGVSWLGDGGIYGDQLHRFEVKRPNHCRSPVRGHRRPDIRWLQQYFRTARRTRSVAGPESDRVQAGGPNGLNSPPDLYVGEHLPPWKYESSK